MVNQQKNIWKYFDDWKIHSDQKRKLNKICKEANGNFCTEYFTKKGKLFAWDIIVPNENINLARKILKSS